MMRDLSICVGAALVVISLAFLGVPLWLGAHPLWHASIALIGAPAGSIVGLLLRRRLFSGVAPVAVAFALSVGALGVAYFGKVRFATSYAEDAAAGQMWYFGWIATAAFAALTLSLLPRAR